MSIYYLSVNGVDEECLLTIEEYIKEKEAGSTVRFLNAEGRLRRVIAKIFFDKHKKCLKR